ncbi:MULTISPECIES: hypothetical protein [Galbibacter]|uniref:Uncharacterized protein n=1 Tax=Galbibacter orientalis DSM 19592 TaxID=926559 RepID=I3C9Z8_9FLAO|nr:hypothetical protein [Galbibacter orientalis]EIJ40441.1 hypothetical protein JoomaDRAFT_3500 [Galbibacter orientalis DSM 19592]
MKKPLLLLSISILIIGCISQKQYAALEANQKELESEINQKNMELNTIYEQYSNTELFMKTQRLKNFSGNIINDSISLNSAKLSTDYSNSDLPKSFLERNFFIGLSANSYDINRVVGRFYKKVADNKYSPVTLEGELLKEGKLIEVDIIDDGALFKSYIEEGSSLNGSTVFGGFEAGKKEVIEIGVVDVAKASIPTSSINKELYNKYLKKIQSFEDSDKYYYVETVTLTIATGNLFKEDKFKASIAASTYFTVGGETYKSSNLFKRNRILSVDFSNVSNLIATINLDDE